MQRREVILAMAGGLATLPLSAAAAITPLDENGFQKLLASNKGKVALYNFWATWCEPCRKEMPLLVKLHAKLKPKGFSFVTISADEPEDVDRAGEFLAKAGVTAPAYLKNAKDDEKFINAIDQKWSGALPALFLYDKTGKKVQSFVGETEIAALEAAISRFL